ncbi:NAD(P)H-binding protein [Companilactobacillus keshanensis]|uniref:NAD(P)H-binding protein n=1 Tax=Companilactobacillus keshanensis TaxID=2486003 RepID=A0ABW4BTC8_9LACO|nr:NAD(P)H-binding protein [Companilactobacillus keshanensis]
MTNVLIIGATGSVGQTTRNYFLDNTNDNLTLMSRHTQRLNANDDREKVIQGDVTDSSILSEALKEQDVVFAALSGNLAKMADSIVKAMDNSEVKRLIFITSMGIYNEIPTSVGSDGNLSSNPMLQTYRNAADIIETSDLNYTIIRPGWFDNSNDTNYEITHKGEPFGGHDVSLKSIADLVVKLSHDSKLGSHDSLGINRK